MSSTHTLYYSKQQALSLERFREMDYFAVQEFELPIELMMENAGLQLARLVARLAEPRKIIQIGAGNGNNGGGGLVAARRLAAWGYQVHLDIWGEIDRPLPARQLSRALRFGVANTPLEQPDVWVDAYLGFSQQLPLPVDLLERIHRINALDGQRIALDLPTGFLGDLSQPHFKAHHVLTLAAPKTILFELPPEILTYVADLGIPSAVYERFEAEIPPFYEEGYLPFQRNADQQTKN